MKGNFRLASALTWRMMPKQAKKSRAQLEEQNRSLRRQRLGRSASSVISDVVRYGAWVLIARYAYLSIRSLAGKESTAEVVLQILTDFRIREFLLWMAAAFAILYGRWQRKLRHDVIERLEARTASLETRIDPDRTSSGLTTRGTTHPMDER